jgi:hypothetical protein
MVRTSFHPSLALGARWALFAAALSGAAARAAGQSVGGLTFVNRNGSNVAYCGPTGASVGADHDFLTPTATADSIVLSEPGGPTWGASSASSQLSASPSASGLTLSSSGSVQRDPLAVFGVYATADARDDWAFTLSEPVRYTFHVALNATSTETVISHAAYFFVGPAITPDPGSPPAPYGASLTAPGTYTLASSGTLGPGQYLISLSSRTESVFNSYPFAGTSQNSLTLVLEPLAMAVPRNVAPNPLSYSATPPVLGQSWSGSVDVAVSGHDFAQIFGSFAPAQVPLPGGPVLLISPPVFAVTPPLAGPVAGFTVPLPADPALAGLFIPTQALHSGGAPTFALSNAIDLTFGY